MYDMLKVIFGAIVVGDFLLAIGLFVLWKSGQMPPNAPETKDADN